MGGSWLVVSWAGGGNVNPCLTLAGHLAGRGHRVAAVAGAGLAPRLDAAGVEVVTEADGWLPGADDVRRAVERFSPDALIVDYMLTGALCAAEASGLPTVALVHTLYTALLADGAPHPIGMAGPVEAVNRIRGEIGLAPVAAYAELLSAVDVVLVAAPRQLDEVGEVPGKVFYAGALLEEAGARPSWSPPAGEGPLVVVSLGTAGEAAAESDLLARVLAALGHLPVRGLVTLPQYLEPDRFDPPGNVVLSGYIPHTAVLPHADLLVTHAGLGSVLAALSCGVPMVCIPLGRDQPENALAVARVGAGRVLPADAHAGQIAATIRAELAGGRRVRIEPDPKPAVDLLEGLLAG